MDVATEILKQVPQDIYMRGVFIYYGKRRIEWRVVGPKCFEQLAKTFVHMPDFIDPYVKKNIPLT